MGKDLGWLTNLAATLPKELAGAQQRSVQQIALTTVRAMRVEVKRVTGGDGRLSGVGRRGARVGARYQLLSKAQTPTAVVRATGPAHLLEHPTRPHDITPRRRRRGQGSKALRFRDGTFRPAAHHPGINRPAKPYEKGYLAVRDQSGPIYNKQIENTLRKAVTR